MLLHLVAFHKFITDYSNAGLCHCSYKHTVGIIHLFLCKCLTVVCIRHEYKKYKQKHMSKLIIQH